MKYLVLDEEGNVFKTAKLTDEIVRMVKGGYWTVVDIQNELLGVSSEDFTEVRWREIPSYFNPEGGIRRMKAKVTKHNNKAPFVKTIPDVIYIPFNPDDPNGLASRKRLLSEMKSQGFYFLGSYKLTDPIDNSSVHVWILTRE